MTYPVQSDGPPFMRLSATIGADVRRYPFRRRADWPEEVLHLDVGEAELAAVAQKRGSDSFDARLMYPRPLDVCEDEMGEQLS